MHPLRELALLRLPPLSVVVPNLERIFWTAEPRLTRSATHSVALFAASFRSNTSSLNVPFEPSRSYAFVEFRSQRDAEDAYYDMYVIRYSHSVRHSWHG